MHRKDQPARPQPHQEQQLYLGGTRGHEAVGGATRIQQRCLLLSISWCGTDFPRSCLRQRRRTQLACRTSEEWRTTYRETTPRGQEETIHQHQGVMRCLTTEFRCELLSAKNPNTFGSKRNTASTVRCSSRESSYLRSSP